MKTGSLLIALIVLFGANLQAQSTTTVEKNTKRITITTTKTDENGKPVSETWIAEGEEPEVILKNMAVNPEILQKVEVDNPAPSAEGERLFLFRSAGDHQTIEGRLDDVSGDHIAPGNDGGEKVIVWTRNTNDRDHEYKVAHLYNKDGSVPWEYSEERKVNCAALGVYVNATGEKTGCQINGLIDKGGAQEAGLVEGDVITKLDDYVITDFPTLYDALTHYLPGDDATVIYTHEGKSTKANVHLRSWADMPGQEWRARGDCGHIEDFKDEIVKPIAEDKLPEFGPVGMDPLKLEDARIYPNPTPGTFALSFTTEPGALSISVTDVNGKVIYSEKNDNATGYYNHDIDLGKATPGNYVVTIKQGDKVFTQQLSKQ